MNSKLIHDGFEKEVSTTKDGTQSIVLFAVFREKGKANKHAQAIHCAVKNLPKILRGQGTEIYISEKKPITEKKILNGFGVSTQAIRKAHDKGMAIVFNYLAGDTKKMDSIPERTKRKTLDEALWPPLP